MLYGIALIRWRTEEVEQGEYHVEDEGQLGQYNELDEGIEKQAGYDKNNEN